MVKSSHNELSPELIDAAFEYGRINHEAPIPMPDFALPSFETLERHDSALKNLAATAHEAAGRPADPTDWVVFAQRALKHVGMNDLARTKIFDADHEETQIGLLEAALSD